MILPEINMKKTIYSTEHKVLIEKLKKARTEAELDQKSVADLLGRTQSYISKIEAGQRRVDFVQLKMFAKIYKKSLDYFFSR
jgi:transcriptional regulator with XRE-family HTH domain